MADNALARKDDFTAIANAIKAKNPDAPSRISFPWGFIGTLEAIPVQGEETLNTHTIPLAEEHGTGIHVHQLISDNQFVKHYYNYDGFFAMLLPLDIPHSAEYTDVNYVNFIYNSNKYIVSVSKSPIEYYYGFTLYTKTNFSGRGYSTMLKPIKTPESESRQAGSLYADETGGIKFVSSSQEGWGVLEGNYQLIYGLRTFPYGVTGNLASKPVIMSTTVSIGNPDQSAAESVEESVDEDVMEPVVEAMDEVRQL